jgi:malonyl-CoA/methylmalonyl-CoA synthetase
MASPGSSSPAAGWADRLAGFGDRTAVLDPDGAHTFAEILDRGRSVARALLAGRPDLDGERVAVVCRPGRDFCAAVLGVWLAGGMAVPLHPAHPLAELTHPVTDAGVSEVVCSSVHRALGEALAAVASIAEARVLEVSALGAAPGPALPELPSVDPERPALMVYTSGTTGAPKGAVHTHRSVLAQVVSMGEAWQWSSADRVLLVLPLHHVHGIVNITLTALWSGALCEAQGGFEPLPTWERLASEELTLFMAVPTIYARLVAAWEAADEGTRARWSAGAARLRLMVSGSAALPVETLDRWERITGQRLLERYGMTELGMVLGNRLDQRVPGHVGWPFPRVEVRLVGDDGVVVAPGEPGELQVRGPQTFAGYWNRPEATAESFVDGWFRTGDVAALDPEGYRLLGRASVDILKTGGEKVSALEIEEVFRTHPAIDDCAVVGVPDPEWGDRVCIAVVGAPGAPLPSIDELRAWGKERLAPAKVPSRLLVVDELPRNALGKVTKPAVSGLFAAG